MADTSKTVDLAVRVMHQIRSSGPAPTSELARRLGLGRTVVARLVATLEGHDLLRRTPAGIDLGYGLVGLADRVAPAVRHAARPHLQGLAATFNETAVLAVVDGDDAVAVDQVVPEGRVVRIHYHPGTRHPLAVAAHGRAMLAHVEPAVVARLAGGDPDLLAELARVRRLGHAVSHDELEEGVAGVAAAIVDQTGRPLGSLGVVAPAARLPSANGLAVAIVDAAAAVAAQVAALDSRHPPGGQAALVTAVPGP
ncbi:MAG: IclR family transcriptional regulator C-terminal domain-containing protein [Acidimicrobiia bacterium]